jgi:hypothetical protein
MPTPSPKPEMLTYLVSFYRDGVLMSVKPHATRDLAIAACEAWEAKGQDHHAIREEIRQERKLRSRAGKPMENM